MSGPKQLLVRPPAVAGRFYPADPEECRERARSFLRPSALANGGRWIGGMVPHAGWMCSGAVAGEVIATIAEQWMAAGEEVDVVVVFGAIHAPLRIEWAALDWHERWSLPGGESEISSEVERRLQERGNLFEVDGRLHEREHAVEVNVPLLQLAFASAMIVPVEVPVIGAAELMGRKTAQSIMEAKLRAVYLASSDLTHYGPGYRFSPMGVGPEALQWAKENDCRLLELVREMKIEQVVPEAQQHRNACGAGAIAAMLAACREMGASRGRVLRHTTSFEALAEVAPQSPVNAVGYAGVVIG